MTVAYIVGTLCGIVGFAPYAAIIYQALYAQHRISMAQGILSVILSFVMLILDFIICWFIFPQLLVQFGIALISAYCICMIAALGIVFIKMFRF